MQHIHENDLRRIRLTVYVNGNGNRYDNDTIKLVRQFEKLDCKHRKILLDLNFLENYIKNNVTPKFLQFRLANKDLRSSPTYR